MPAGRSTPRRRLEIGSLAAVPLGVAVILLGQLIEGGALQSLLQGAAALIVFGGTIAAVLVSFSPAQVWRAVLAARRAFFADPQQIDALAAKLVALAIRGHRYGVTSLENELPALDDVFLKNGLMLAIDGAPPETIQQILAVEKTAWEADEDAPARVFEAAAGYAPTLGILGAVLGLIQVMNHLGTPGALGSGIAVAFVATVYGVGSANLIFLPIAGRLRERTAAAARRRHLITEGLHAISTRTNPRLVAQRLRPLAPRAPRVEDIAARVNAAMALRRSA